MGRREFATDERTKVGDGIAAVRACARVCVRAPRALSKLASPNSLLRPVRCVLRLPTPNVS